MVKKNTAVNSKGKVHRKNAKKVAQGKRNKSGVKKAGRKAHTAKANKNRMATRKLKVGQSRKQKNSKGVMMIITRTKGGISKRVASPKKAGRPRKKR